VSILITVLCWLGLALLVVGLVGGLLSARSSAADGNASRASAAWRGRQAAASIVLLALFVQSLALFAHGVEAQRATGSYWTWSQGECAQLAAWLATAIVCVMVSRLGGAKPRR